MDGEASPSFCALAKADGIGHQELINRTLRQALTETRLRAGRQWTISWPPGAATGGSLLLYLEADGTGSE